ncbi:hypothetical protein, conserved [Eimeria brunetti]|uniref:Uncharacterized protein n=1 Tax=Eimeria brunetti TaxID=51314 RepID=U6LFI4_9EIME|nr:hypothetical protein, conserved [Eimeria brunetti]
MPGRTIRAPLMGEEVAQTAWPKAPTGRAELISNNLQLRGVGGLRWSWNRCVTASPLVEHLAMAGMDMLVGVVHLGLWLRGRPPWFPDISDEAADDAALRGLDFTYMVHFSLITGVIGCILKALVAIWCLRNSVFRVPRNGVPVTMRVAGLQVPADCLGGFRVSGWFISRITFVWVVMGALFCLILGAPLSKSFAALLLALFFGTVGLVTPYLAAAVEACRSSRWICTSACAFPKHRPPRAQHIERLSGEARAARAATRAERQAAAAAAAATEEEEEGESPEAAAEAAAEESPEAAAEAAAEESPEAAAETAEEGSPETPAEAAEEEPPEIPAEAPAAAAAPAAAPAAAVTPAARVPRGRVIVRPLRTTGYGQLFPMWLQWLLLLVDVYVRLLDFIFGPLVFVCYIIRVLLDKTKDHRLRLSMDSQGLSGLLIVIALLPFLTSLLAAAAACMLLPMDWPTPYIAFPAPFLLFLSCGYPCSSFFAFLLLLLLPACCTLPRPYAAAYPFMELVLLRRFSCIDTALEREQGTRGSNHTAAADDSSGSDSSNSNDSSSSRSKCRCPCLQCSSWDRLKRSFNSSSNSNSSSSSSSSSDPTSTSDDPSSSNSSSSNDPSSTCDDPGSSNCSSSCDPISSSDPSSSSGPSSSQAAAAAEAAAASPAAAAAKAAAAAEATEPPKKAAAAPEFRKRKCEIVCCSCLLQLFAATSSRLLQ